MSVLAPNSQLFYRFSHPKDQFPQTWSDGLCLFLVKNSGFGLKDQKNSINGRNLKKREIIAHAAWPDLSRPSTVEMESIKDCDQLDQILQQAKDNSQPIIIDWMANWCRKCIYLKPKLEKMAAEYDTNLCLLEVESTIRVKFYYVDVNNVPQALVKRGNISKMPTIQLWLDGEMKAEVIGGHKAWLVLEEVKDMIQQFI